MSCRPILDSRFRHTIKPLVQISLDTAAIALLAGEDWLGAGAPLVVIGTPLTIDSDSFLTAGGHFESTLWEICRLVKGGA